MKIFRFIVLLLVIIGALNWGLWGFFQYDLVASVFGSNVAPLARLVYGLVGLSGLYALSFFFCRHIYCSPSCCCKKEERK